MQHCAPQTLFTSKRSSRVPSHYYYKDRSFLEQKITQNLVWVSGLLFIEKETTGRSLVYPAPNNQTTFCQLCLTAMNMVGPSQCLLVEVSKAVSDYFNRGINTMQECRFYTNYPDSFKYPHNGRNFLFSTSYLPCCHTLRYFDTPKWLNQTNKSYSNSVWVICAKPLLSFLDQIHTKPVS